MTALAMSLVRVAGLASASVSTVFSSNDPTHVQWPCFRVPSALRIPSTDVVLAFAECRSWTGDGCYIKGRANSSGAQYFNRTICSRRSIDGGVSWQAPAASMLPPKTFAANPSAAWNPVLKTVTLVYDDTTRCAPGVCTIYMSTSHDLGLTFSDPAPALLANGSVVVGFSGPGNSIIAFPNGWMAFATYTHWRNYSTSSPTFWVNVYLSRDTGRTWVQDGPTFLHLGEPSLALLADGSLVLDARCPDGRAPYGGPPKPCDCNCRGTAFRSASGYAEIADRIASRRGRLMTAGAFPIGTGVRCRTTLPFQTPTSKERSWGSPTVGLPLPIQATRRAGAT